MRNERNMKLDRVWQQLITWQWTKRLLHWLIISAGTASELAFLLASIWISLNASVHALVLMFINEALAAHMTELATAAYIALPEMILGLAFVTTISHIRMAYHHDKTAWIWAIMYGLPTVIFLLLSLITLGNSVANIDYQLPAWLIVLRAIAGYWYAFTSLLYSQLGIPQEADRLQEKEAILAQVREEKAALEITIRRLNEQLEEQKRLLAESKKAELALIKVMNKSSEPALQAYSEECITWLKSGIKTASVEEINRYTGISKRRIRNAITSGNLQTAPRNKELILVSSLEHWLQKNDLSDGSRRNEEPETAPMLHIVSGD